MFVLTVIKCSTSVVWDDHKNDIGGEGLNGIEMESTIPKTQGDLFHCSVHFLLKNQIYEAGTMFYFFTFK